MGPFWRSAGGGDQATRTLVELSARPWTARGAALGADATSQPTSCHSDASDDDGVLDIYMGLAAWRSG